MVKGIVGIFLLGVGGLAQTRPAATEPSSVAAQAIAPAAGGGYVGAERCRSCHGAEFREFGKTQHAAIAPAKRDAVTGCEMCHGPGKAHADAEEGAQGNDAAAVAATKLIFAFHTNPQKNAERCMQCHKTSKEQAGFEQSPHMRHGVVCSDCHSMHLVTAAGNPKRANITNAQAAFFSAPQLPEENRDWGLPAGR